SGNRSRQILSSIRAGLEQRDHVFARSFPKQILLEKRATARAENNSSRIAHNNLGLLRTDIACDPPIAINDFPRDRSVGCLEFFCLAGLLRFAARERNGVLRKQGLSALQSFIRREHPRFVHRLLEQLAMTEVTRFDVEDRAAPATQPLARAPDDIRLPPESGRQLPGGGVKAAGQFLMHLSDQLSAERQGIAQ